MFVWLHDMIVFFFLEVEDWKFKSGVFVWVGEWPLDAASFRLNLLTELLILLFCKQIFIAPVWDVRIFMLCSYVFN